jgi:hypothetical protein
MSATFCPIRLGKHEWDDWQPSNVPFATAVAHLQSYRCLRCGAGAPNVLLRTKPSGGEP